MSSQHVGQQQKVVSHQLTRKYFGGMMSAAVDLQIRRLDSVADLLKETAR